MIYQVAASSLHTKPTNRFRGSDLEKALVHMRYYSFKKEVKFAYEIDGNGLNW
jgi:hypothetical protein